MAPPTPLAKFISERESVKDTLNFIDGRVSDNIIAALPQTIVIKLLADLDKVESDLKVVHTGIRTYCADADVDEHKKIYWDITSLINTLHNSLHGILSKFPVAAQPPPASSRSTASSQDAMRLPKLELKTFDGNLLDWISFRDMFKTSVHDSTTISKVQKMTYLQSLLKGEAARQVQSMILSDANYDLAWQQLHDRYQNDREILFATLRRFFGLPVVNPSAGAIRALVDTSRECLRSLEILNVKSEKCSDAILLYTLINKLDSSSRELWELQLKGTSIPALTDLFEFLEQRARALAAGTSLKPRQSLPPRDVKVHHGQSRQQNKCKVCSQSSHPMYKCQVFTTMDVAERVDAVRKHNLCANCLHDGHIASRCSSNGRCRTCNGKHNSLLHRNSEATANTSSDASQSLVLNHHTYDDMKNQSFLATALIAVVGNNGQTHLCRAFLDNGSNTNFITDACAHRLGLRKTMVTAGISGLSATHVGVAHSATSFVFSPHFPSNNSSAVDALVIPKITGKLPSYKCDPSSWSHIRGLTLADPEFHTPANVDILLGADVFWNVLEDGRRLGPVGTPVVTRTRLGWLVGGKRDAGHTAPVMTHFTDVSLDKQLESFWELESIPSKPSLTREEAECEEHFTTHTTRTDDGRFTVALPFKNDKSPLGLSHSLAHRRLLQLERRLLKNPTYKSQYEDFMKEYFTLGHMSLIPPNQWNPAKKDVYYIPHHFVLKEDSTTTKFRVVFDASAKTTSGVSLNENMMTGPKLQDSLWDIVLRFRLHRYAFTADIAKMYRQINVRKQDLDYQRILWRDSPQKEIQEYILNTVTYGTAAAPYLAVKVLQTLATEEAGNFPLASAAALNDFYVDDIMSGADTFPKALQLQTQLLQLMDKGKFSLRKFSSNCEELLDSLTPDLREKQTLHEINLDSSVKALGIRWNTTKDTFQFQYKDRSESDVKLTKRIILSEMSILFDPIGWLSPVILRPKMLIQTLWKLDIGWDDEVPLEIYTYWKAIKEDLVNIDQISINRCIRPHTPTKMTLAGFCDASEKAYGAVVYLVAYFGDKEPLVSLITSKTRVAPTKSVSLPRLELCGAVLLANLIQSVKKALMMEDIPVAAWTDSTIVLCWIKAHPSEWKTFVANRVTEIQNNVPSSCWNHVPGVENPADCCSRGLSAAELVDYKLWWKGPDWITDPSQTPNTPNNIETPADCAELERKKTVMVHTTASTDFPLLHKYSSFTQLIRVSAWLYRFCYNSRLAKAEKCHRQFGTLTPQELTDASNKIIKKVQQFEFPSEINCLIDEKPLPTKSKLLCLNPFLDADGILRVGGRLRNAPISPDRRTPILLPRHSKFTELLIRSTHLQHFHAGPTLLQAVLGRRFWILRGRDAVRFLLKKCVTCTRQKATTQQQFMADLPRSRVTPCRAFQRCGVDYAGPFLLRPDLPRSKSTTKAYLALFVCFSTRAFHLEVVSSLSTEAFLAALRRFVSRRGLPHDIHSDCGTNFVGANRELKEMHQLVTSISYNNKVASDLSTQGIHWHFNPPGAPHFGGLWEAGVKSVKYHLNRIVGSTRLTFEELTTTMTQIEACLNSRPLTPASSDPSDLTALTSGHFLIGEPLLAIPEPDLTSLNQSRLSRWQLIQSFRQQFWKRWSSEFLSRLQQRPKWLQQRTNLKLEDLVLIKEENMPPQKWKLGRVVTLHPGQDQNIRVVTLRTADGELKRPISKLCLLPIHDDIKSDIV